MGKYDIDMKRLAVLLLPTALRQPRLTALAQVLVVPLSGLHRRLTDYHDAKDYRLRHNGQVCHLRAVLNDRFDSALRRIRITEEERTDTALRLYLRETGRFTRIKPRGDAGQVILYRRGFGGVGGLDFWVQLPTALQGTVSEAELCAVVNLYRLASKRYGITYSDITE